MMACAVALAVAGLATAAVADPLVLQLRGPAQFQYAGYYAALWQGFYAEAGLTVEIQPGAPRGQTPTDPVRELAEGRAGCRRQLRAGDPRGAGFAALLLAPIFRKLGTAYYRADGFRSPAALSAKLARLPASDIPRIRLATHGARIDLKKIQIP
jgi:hypothetical protein